MSGRRRRDIIVVKLGGSLISDKSEPFSYRESTVEAVARSILASQQRVVVVHGGGAFGHPLAKRHKLSSAVTKIGSDGVAETRAAMLELNRLICSTLLRSGLRPYTFAPYSPLYGASGEVGVDWIRSLLDSGMTPVTFGDVVVGAQGGGFRVFSGDTIALELSRILSAKRCLYTMDVDGVLDRDGRLIHELSSCTSIDFPPSSDATGGISLKVREALEMAAGGTEVAFVSGFRPSDVLKSLKGMHFHGTKVRVPSP